MLTFIGITKVTKVKSCTVLETIEGSPVVTHPPSPSHGRVGWAGIRVKANRQYFAHFGTKANKSMQVAVNYIGAFLRKNTKIWLL